MRFLFLDEGGISKHEPVVVVAGVFVHGDDQIIPLEEHLDELIAKHIPPEHRHGFAFHATRIWSRKGIFKDKDEWPPERRIAILEDLAAIPKKFDIPIIYYRLEKERLTVTDSKKPVSQTELDVAGHSMVFTGCTILADRFVRNKWPGEVVQIVAEDNDQARHDIKRMNAILRNPGAVFPDGHPMREFLPLRRIRNSPQFAEKDESKPLQLADLCAFAIRGHLGGHEIGRRLFARLRGNIIPWDFDPEVAWPFGPLAYSSAFEV